MEDQDAVETRDPLRRYLARPGRRRLAEVVRAYYGLVWKCAIRVTGNAEDAADICQDIFLKLLVDPPLADRIRAPSAYLAWCVLDRARRLRRMAERRQAREEAAARRARSDALPAEDIEALHAAIASLSEDLRTPLELSYLLGLPNRDIAEFLEISERTLSDRLRRGREILRQRLAPLGLAALTPPEQGSAPRLAPPPGLLGQLLRVVRMGSAVAPPSATTAVRGAIMTNKIAMALGIAALVGGLSLWYGVRRLDFDPQASRTRPVAVNAPEKRTGPDTGHESEAPESQASTQDPAPAPEPAPASLRGMVLGPDGRLVPGATVTIMVDLDNAEATELLHRGYRDAAAGNHRFGTSTDDRGVYAQAGLLPTEVGVTVKKEGLVSAFGLRRATLKPGEETTLNLELCRGLRLTGRIMDRVGRPLAGGKVYVDPYEMLDLAERFDGGPFDADEDGRFDTGYGLTAWKRARGRPNWFQVSAVAAGYAASSQNVASDDFVSERLDLEFRLEPEMPILVRVTDPASRPIEAAKVQAYAARWLETLTDGMGAARIEHLARAPQDLLISKEGYFSSTPRLAAGTSAEVAVTMHPIWSGGPPIQGEVTFDTSIPSGLRRWGTPYPESDLRSGHFSRLALKAEDDPKSRTYALRPLPGRYRVCFRAGCLEATTEPFEYMGTESVRADLHVRMKPPLISGVVVSEETGLPVEDVPVVAEGLNGAEPVVSWSEGRTIEGFRFPMVLPSGEPDRTVTDVEGRFLLAVPRPTSPREDDAECRILLRAGSVRHGWSRDLVLSIGKDETRSDVRLSIIRSGAIDGTVTSEAGEPARSQLIVIFDGRSLLETTLTDAEGRYRFDHLRPDRYVLEALGRTVEPRDRAWRSMFSEDVLPLPHDLMDRRVEVRPGQVVRWDMDLRTDRLGALQVRLGEGLPSEGVCYYSMIIEGMPRPLECPWDCRWIHRGRASFENLLPGRYRVTMFERDAGFAAESEVDVRRGEITEVMLERPRATLIVHIEGGIESLCGLRLVEAERRHASRARALLTDMVRTNEVWIGCRATRIPGGLRVEGLPSGTVRVRLAAFGHRVAYSEWVAVTEGREAIAPPVTLAPGRDIRVRLEAPEWARIPDAVTFAAIRHYPSRREEFATYRDEESNVWILSAFEPGEYNVRACEGKPLYGFANVTVPPDRDVEVTIRLEFEGF